MILDQVLYNTTKSNKSNRSAPQESTMRSILKSVSWRVIGTLDTVLISYMLTGQVRTAFAIGGVELITKMILYVAHERVWNRIKYGKRP